MQLQIVGMHSMHAFMVYMIPMTSTWPGSRSVISADMLVVIKSMSYLRSNEKT